MQGRTPELFPEQIWNLLLARWRCRMESPSITGDPNLTQPLLRRRAGLAPSSCNAWQFGQGIDYPRSQRPHYGHRGDEFHRFWRTIWAFQGKVMPRGINS